MQIQEQDSRVNLTKKLKVQLLFFKSMNCFQNLRNKVNLLEKSHKQKLSHERSKHLELQKKLDKANIEMDKLKLEIQVSI